MRGSMLASVCLALSSSLLAQSISTSAVAPQAPSTVPTTGAISPSAQGVSPGMRYHRVYVISPLVGAGTKTDPKRPVFAPTPPQPGSLSAALAVAPHTGLLGYQMQMSDDGTMALVEMVFSDPIAFQAVMQQELSNRGVTAPAISPGAAPAAVSTSLSTSLQSAVPGLQIFERGKATDSQILSAFQQYKAKFSFAGTTVRPQ